MAKKKCPRNVRTGAKQKQEHVAGMGQLLFVYQNWQTHHAEHQ